MSSLFWERVKTDRDFRIKVFLFLSILFNATYAIFLCVASHVYHSKWFFATSIYYALLSASRIFIYFQIDPQKNLYQKIKIMRACGYFLFALNVVVSVVLFILIRNPEQITYHEITVITLATYTFSALSIAIVSSIKHVKKKNYVYSCVKIISLISATISLTTLTNTMLSTFGENNALLRGIILPLLSSFVSIFIIFCAVLMIVESNIALRILKNEQKRK